MFRGLLPNSSIDSFTKQTTPQITTTNTNTSDVFTKNLKVGDTDQEVLLLQKALNEDPDTVIAASGAGSPGNETTYFGQRTKTAVIKLQNKHYGEVLAPNGLSSGTGYFGASTRAMMNNQQKNKDKNSVQSLGESVITTIPNAAVSGLGETVKIESLDPPRGKSGTQVTIHGSGITRSANRIIAGGQMTYNATSTDGRTLTFTIKSPAEFIFDPELSVASTTYIKSHFSEYVTKDFPILKYPVCIQNDNGLSNCAFFTIDL
jgi:peptidoglycan hydrolase-like protein with peptidoglycan-binding domain